jgi:CelD/BcsL family acetyltransferase involved in cellulose biosynthesis
MDPLRDSRWGAFVATHPRGSVFHSTNWLQALQAAYGYDPVVATACAPGAPLSNGIVFCRVESWLTGRRFVSLPFSDHCEPLVNNAGELDQLLQDMRRYVDQEKYRYLEIRPISSQPGSRSGLTKSTTFSLHRLDLERSNEELFRRFHKDCVQRKIRRAEREKLSCQAGTSAVLLQAFYKLHVMTRRRHYLPPQPLSWFRRLVAAFGDSLTIRVAFKGEIPVASILTLVSKKSLVYKYGCSDARFHNFGGMPLLFWITIQEAKQKGFEELEMGRSDNDNLGLISFKEHFGAVGTPLSYWVYARRPDLAAQLSHENMLRRLVPLAPNSVLRAVGKILYRHIG